MTQKFWLLRQFTDIIKCVVEDQKHVDLESVWHPSEKPSVLFALILLWTNVVFTVYGKPLNVKDGESDLPWELFFLFSSFSNSSFRLDGSAGNLSSSTIMDVLRNKARTWKVSNQQHIFQKMADPILYTSLRPPLNCWCVDPSLIWRSVSELKRRFSDCFCLQQPARWASTGGVLTTCLRDIQQSTIKTCKPAWQIIHKRQKRWGIILVWRLVR